MTDFQHPFLLPQYIQHRRLIPLARTPWLVPKPPPRGIVMGPVSVLLLVGLVSQSGIVLGLVSVPAAIWGMLGLAAWGYRRTLQVCPQCLWSMARGARRCPRCGFDEEEEACGSRPWW